SCGRPVRILEASSTTRPGARKALGLAGPDASTRSAGPRLAQSFQTAERVDASGPISESETAFLAKHGQANARAAQRRPGAEHQARPGPPEHFRFMHNQGAEQGDRAGNLLRLPEQIQVFREPLRRRWVVFSSAAQDL